MSDYEMGVHASPHRIGSLMWAMDKSVAVRVVVSLLALVSGVLLGSAL